jgi:hypothetical protein
MEIYLKLIQLMSKVLRNNLALKQFHFTNVIRVIAPYFAENLSCCELEFHCN